MKRSSNPSLLMGLLLTSLALASCGGDKPVAQAAQAAAPAAAEESAPAHVIVSAPVGAGLPDGYAELLGTWQEQGVVSGALLLQQYDGPEAPGFSSLAVLDFPTEAAYRQWNQSEAKKLDASLTVRRADLLTNKERNPRDSGKAVFVVSRYESQVSSDDYDAYTETYIVPNMSNQYYSGIMNRYTMYIEREASAPQQKPKAFLLTEYADDAEFARKDAVKGSYKEVLLAHHPEWKRINDTKSGIRTDLDETLARQVPLQ